ncbi:MAG: glycosyltransferase, partial [Actinomycetota bacterium]|nr:glycosyltransferase [Actinomycetota bacterium]
MIAELVAFSATAIWVLLLLAPGRYWTTAVRLPPAPGSDTGPAARPAAARPAAARPAGPGSAVARPAILWPSVAVVVPARNEADLLPLTLPSLMAQDYPGPLRVVLVDDASSDGTAEVAARCSAGGRAGVEVLEGAPRPDGWAGKLWALHQGIDLCCGAGASPEWVLFTDADVRHPPGSVRALVAAAVSEGRDVVSLMVRLRVVTAWERLLVPAFVYFFAQLYPFRLVAGPGRTAAAAGGCVLVRRAALERAGGIAAIRDAVIDDVALARALKRSGARIWLGLADEVRSVRPYPRLADLWRMVARSAFTQLRYSPVLLGFTLVGLVLVYLGPPIALVVGVVRVDRSLA